MRKLPWDSIIKVSAIVTLIVAPPVLIREAGWLTSTIGPVAQAPVALILRWPFALWPTVAVAEAAVLLRGLLVWLWPRITGKVGARAAIDALLRTHESNSRALLRRELAYVISDYLTILAEASSPAAALEAAQRVAPQIVSFVLLLDQDMSEEERTDLAGFITSELLKLRPGATEVWGEVSPVVNLSAFQAFEVVNELGERIEARLAATGT